MTMFGKRCCISNCTIAGGQILPVTRTAWWKDEGANGGKLGNNPATIKRSIDRFGLIDRPRVEGRFD
jgi:hypothetical protein